MIRTALRFVPEIFIAMLMLATVATGILSAASCMLPPFRLLTCGFTEGSQRRFQLKMQKGLMLVEAWTLRDGAFAGGFRRVSERFSGAP